MDEHDIVTVARYTDPFAANLAKSKLEDADIRAMVVGGETTAFSGVVGLVGSIHVRVAREYVERATNILRSLEDDIAKARRADTDDPAVYSENVWVCSLCGSANDEDLSTCPDCATPRESIRSATPSERPSRSSEQIKSDEPRSTKSDERVTQRDSKVKDDVPSRSRRDTEEEIELPNLDTFLGDDIAKRAFYSALFTPAFCPLFFYSCWQLWKMSSFDGKLSTRGRLFMFGALGLTCLYGFLFWFAFHAFFGRTL